MYNVEIGHKLLAIYNEGKSRKLSGKEFFDEVMFPMFFDTDDDSLHLMQVSNSSFFQAYPEKDRIKGRTLGSLKLERHHRIVAEIEAGRRMISGAIAVGYAAGGPSENTSGQVTNINQLLNSETIAYTWIGAACGIGLAGGANILINNVRILRYIFEGWAYYRRFLNENTNFKGRQIETWNSLWLVYGIGAPDPEESYRLVMDKLPQHHGITTKKESSLTERPDWFRLVIALAQNEYLDRQMQAYAYKYGSMNTTLGFLSIELSPVRNLAQIFQVLLSEVNLNQYSGEAAYAELRKIFQAHYALADLIALGGISIRTLRPAKVEAFMKANKPEKSQENFHYSILIKSWIIAMLNNDQLADLARDLGRALRDIELNSRENATVKIEVLLDAGGKTAFIIAANELKEHKGVIEAKEPSKREKIDNAIQVLKQAEDAAQRHIPSDQLPLFRALAKSEYLMAKYFSASENS